jgi:membrane dipeptidase
MLIVDAHQDLAWNMLTFGRDYTLSAAEIRQREAGTVVAGRKEDALLGWPDYQRGQVAIAFATLFAAPARRCMQQWESQCYSDTNQAYHLYNTQLDIYHRLVDDHADKFRLIQTHRHLQSTLDGWQKKIEVTQPEPTTHQDHPVGLVILMEGAEGVRTPSELEQWWENGVRIIGPAWAGTRFCGGTNDPGGLTREGFELLEAMAAIGFSLDLSHMDEAAVQQALDFYPGPIIASHSNAQALLKGVPGNRLLPDAVIQNILQRDGLIGVVVYNGFLHSSWRSGDRRNSVTLAHVAAQIDYICQMSGDARHVGLGSDFDGGFGLQSVPSDVDTIADLQKLAPLLVEKGYSEVEVASILGQNWINFLIKNLPES